MIWIVVVLAVIALIVYAIGLAFQYWYITGTLTVIGVLIFAYKQNRRLRKEQQAAQQQRIVQLQTEERERVRRYNDKQKQCWSQILKSVENSAVSFEVVPQRLLRVERNLDQAESDFNEGVFAPFWDSIERAVFELCQADEKINEINDCSSSYTHAIDEYRGTIPEFPVDRNAVSKLAAASADTATRMRQIVRAAQRNFQFASIYEQRKTNQLLVAGFKNLAQAIDQIGWQISTSIDNLAQSVESLGTPISDLHSQIGASLQGIYSELGDIAEEERQHRSNFEQVASEASAREKKALHMLDNIQHGRRPSLLEG